MKICLPGVLLAVGIYVLVGSFLGPGSAAQDANMDKPKHTNRLIHSLSPYLLQHAHNPVDWYPWGREALDRAKRDNKPIFLSIGYSACHWCHVMERESFENEEIARILNKHFLCIKVDREERPDLDQIYMTAVQLMTGSGGWPMSVFLTPELKPFYGGTYFPPTDSHGRPGFKRILLALAAAYRDRPRDIEGTAKQIVDALKRSTAGHIEGAGALSRDLVEQAVQELKQRFDSQWGGFGSAPKFPSPNALSLLLRHHRRTGDQDALHMVTLTLERMASGGMYDQVGGGFHRYSVDREWLVPHFEKMLYDNAQLARVYLDAFLATKRPLYRRIARETLAYVLRDMADESGGFHSTLDADSEGEEGTYYLWSMTEVKRLLPGRDGDLFCEYYGITKAGNFEGRNILHRPVPLEDFAQRARMEPDEWRRRLDAMRQKLLMVRARRVPPKKDDKVLTDWNALMISALARGYAVLGDEAYRAAAERAARFVLTQMGADHGRLLHAYRAGQSHIDAYLDDYAFVALAFLDLYQATFDVQWVEYARDLTRQMVERFWDDARGGFFLTGAGQPDAIVRSKSAEDGATPSGNAIAASALLLLGKLTDGKGYLERAEKTLAAFQGAAQRSPHAFAGLLCSLDFHLGPSREVAVVGPMDDSGTAALLAATRRRYMPNAVVAMIDPRSPNAAAAARVVPLLAARPMVDGRPAVYVCRNSECRAPVTEVQALEKLLDEF